MRLTSGSSPRSGRPRRSRWIRRRARWSPGPPSKRPCGSWPSIPRTRPRCGSRWSLRHRARSPTRRPDCRWSHRRRPGYRCCGRGPWPGPRRRGPPSRSPTSRSTAPRPRTACGPCWTSSRRPRPAIPTPPRWTRGRPSPTASCSPGSTAWQACCRPAVSARATGSGCACRPAPRTCTWGSSVCSRREQRTSRSTPTTPTSALRRSGRRPTSAVCSATGCASCGAAARALGRCGVRYPPTTPGSSSRPARPGSPRVSPSATPRRLRSSTPRPTCSSRTPRSDRATGCWPGCRWRSTPRARRCGSPGATAPAWCPPRVRW